MHPFPHHYRVAAHAAAVGDVTLAVPGLDSISSDAPAEFDGPGNRWSPETLVTAALADCFTLSFRAVAAASKLTWTSLQVETVATLDRVQGVSRITHVHTRARLVVAPGVDQQRARRLLEKAEQICIVSNSMSAERQLELEVSG